MIRYLAPAALALLAFAGTAQARPVVDSATAECIVSEAARPVRTLLDTVPDSDAERTALTHVKDAFEACNGGERKLGDWVDPRVIYVLRADLAEASLREGTFAKRPAPASVAPWFDLAQLNSVSRARYNFGLCLAAADPAATTQLLRSYPETPDEKQAINALRTKVSGCVAKGIQLRLAPADVRQMVAEPVYHNIIASRRG